MGLMRFVALFALMFLMPLFACLPAGTAYAAELININTADAALLDTLPGIGPSKAQAIIDYRTQNGPFARIEDIQNVSGIGPATYANIAPLITVGGTNVSKPPLDTSNSTSAITTTSTSSTTFASGGESPEYIPIPTLRIVTFKNRVVSSGADTAFTATVYDNKGNKRDNAVVLWSFGDGMQRTGASVYHTYFYPGEYVAVVHVITPDGGDALAELIITVEDANIDITSISPRGISLTNNGSHSLDISLWRLSMGGKEFKIPENTQILTGRTILFPSQVIQLSNADSASLLYPSGEVAATYPETKATVSFVQPSMLQTGFSKVQTVESVTNTNIKTHEETVIAPTVATELAAVGAALPAATKKSGGIFSSPWFLGLLGVVVLAGAVFIFI